MILAMLLAIVAVGLIYAGVYVWYGAQIFYHAWMGAREDHFVEAPPQPEPTVRTSEDLVRMFSPLVARRDERGGL